MDFFAENLDKTKEELREIPAKKYICPIVEVAKYDSLKLVSKLIQIDPRIVNTVNAEHCTALHFATSTSCCNFLLQHGAKVNAESLLCTTSLHMASFHGYDEVVEILLKYNVNTKIKSQGETVPPATALNLARHNNHQRCIDLIEAHEKQLDPFTKIMNILIAIRINVSVPRGFLIIAFFFIIIEFFQNITFLFLTVLTVLFTPFIVL
jgi:ankyrin repeat protein